MPRVFIDGCMDSSWDEFPEVSPRRVKSLGAEIRRAIEESREVLGIEITEEVLKKSIAYFTRLWVGIIGLWEFMKRDPIPVSQVDLGLLWWMAASPERRCIAEGLGAIATLTKEVKQRVDEGKGVVEKGAPRVLMLGHHATDPSIMRMIEDAGLAIPATVYSAITTLQVASYAETRYTAVEEKIAHILLSNGLYHSASALIYRYRELCKTWNPDGALNLYHFSCRAFIATPLIVKKALEEDPGIPVLLLEGDLWDTRDYSAQALRTRVETFAEMLRVAKAT